MSNTTSVQRKVLTPAVARAPAEVVKQGTQTAGRPLPPRIRERMEARFGHDFGQVRVHTDRTAGESATALAATAYTIGSDIVFRPDAYSPESDTGEELLTHELTHVVQQEGVSRSWQSVSDLPISRPGDASEREADAVADETMAGDNFGNAQHPTVQRQGEPPDSWPQSIPNYDDLGLPPDEPCPPTERLPVGPQVSEQTPNVDIVEPGPQSVDPMAPTERAPAPNRVVNPNGGDVQINPHHPIYDNEGAPTQRSIYTDEKIPNYDNLGLPEDECPPTLRSEPSAPVNEKPPNVRVIEPGQTPDEPPPRTLRSAELEPPPGTRAPVPEAGPAPEASPAPGAAPAEAGMSAARKMLLPSVMAALALQEVVETGNESRAKEARYAGQNPEKFGKDYNTPGNYGKTEGTEGGGGSEQQTAPVEQSVDPDAQYLKDHPWAAPTRPSGTPDWVPQEGAY